MRLAACYATMLDMTASPLHATIAQNVRVLMAMRGIYAQQELGERIGMGKAELSKRLNGKLRWQLDDLDALADSLGVQPADLLRPVHEVVGAVAATGTGADYSIRGDTPRREGIMEGIKHPYSPAYSPAPPLTSNDAGRRKGHLTLLPPTSEADTNDDNEADREQRSARGQLTASPDWSASARVMVAV